MNTNKPCPVKDFQSLSKAWGNEQKPPASTKPPAETTGSSASVLKPTAAANGGSQSHANLHARSTLSLAHTQGRDQRKGVAQSEWADDLNWLRKDPYVTKRYRFTCPDVEAS